jgi:outer membrane protein OmpA-like peptidoglycan-associated protein
VSRLVALMPHRLAGVTCAGHTDSTGGGHRVLGLGRAQAVCRTLRGAGVKAHFRMVSYGARRPRATNRTTAGRALNRRVELTLRYR